MAIKLEPAARSIAAHVFERVSRESAFASPVLDAALERYPELDPRDRALATELTYGSLRTAPYLEARLSRHAQRGIDKLDSLVRAHLFVAGYQILFLDRVPAFAAVSEAVRQIGAARGKRVGAFANVVLRRLSEEPAGDKRAALETALKESLAPWLRDALVHSLGDAGAAAFVLSSGTPPVGLRVRLGADRTVWLERLRAALPGATLEPGAVSPLAILMRQGSDPEKLASYREGEIAIQEEGAQLIALSLGAEPGEIILDACAGRGNKAALLAEAVGRSGAVHAADQHPQKLARLVTELARLHLSARATFAVDWTIGPGDVPGSFDRVLVDAPCSGVGTLRRRPELVTRREASNLADLCDLQTKILVAAAERAREGGTIVYAVCSVLREECEDVIDRALAGAPWLTSAPFAGEPARKLAGDAHVLRLTPQEHGTDGYFLASLQRRPSPG
jgi:16S rRNA (cytosine967-C5)-methyltransferase